MINCQLCKHLSCDTEGHFICKIDNEILRNGVIECDKFEEYQEDTDA